VKTIHLFGFGANREFARRQKGVVVVFDGL